MLSPESAKLSIDVVDLNIASQQDVQSRMHEFQPRLTRKFVLQHANLLLQILMLAKRRSVVKIGHNLVSQQFKI